VTDPSDYTAKIRAKGLDATGVTDQLAGEMYRNKGRHYMAIVEVKVDETHEKADGTRKVDLVLTQVEPATNIDLEEHLRELTRVGYFNRQKSDGQMAIDDSLGSERTVADVVASGRSLRPHPFLPDDVAKDNPICDVCGGIEASAVHSAQEVLDDPETQEEEPDVQEEDPDAEPDAHNGPGEPIGSDPWEYEQPEGQAATVPDPFAAPANT
jgi:hypothetical protein